MCYRYGQLTLMDLVWAAQWPDDPTSAHGCDDGQSRVLRIGVHGADSDMASRWGDLPMALTYREQDCC